MDISSLAMLANMLAEKFNITVRAAGSQASCAYNPQTQATEIIVPAFVADTDAARVYARGYIDHEVGHARFTDWTALEQYFQKGTMRDFILDKLTNVVEDVYVERRMGECYPGCAINLAAAQEQLFIHDRTFEKSRPKDEYGYMDDTLVIWNIMRYVLYRARNINVLLPMAKADVDSTVPGLTDALEPVFKEIPGIKSSNDTAAIALELFQIIKEALRSAAKDVTDQYMKLASQPSSSSSSSTTQPSDQNTGDMGQNGAQVGSNNQQEGKTKQQEQNAGEAKCDPFTRKPDTPELKQLDDKCHALHEAISALDNGNNMRGATQKAISNAFNEALEGIVHKLNKAASKAVKDVGCGDMKRLDETNCMVQHMPVHLTLKAQGCVAALSAQLQALMQAKVLRKRKSGLFGKLDHNRLHRIACNNPRVFLTNTEKREVNTEVIILGDTSGSMRYIKELTSISIYAVLSALRKIHGVSSAVYGFSGYGLSIMSEFNTPLYRSNLYIAKPNGSTPGGSAVQRILQKFSLHKPDTRRILLLMTDGDFPGGERKLFRAVHEDAKAMGIDIIGVGIKSNEVEDLFDKGDFFVINDIAQLAPKLFEILKARLV